MTDDSPQVPAGVSPVTNFVLFFNYFESRFKKPIFWVTSYKTRRPAAHKGLSSLFFILRMLRTHRLFLTSNSTLHLSSTEHNSLPPLLSSLTYHSYLPLEEEKSLPFFLLELSIYNSIYCFANKHVRALE